MRKESSLAVRNSLLCVTEILMLGGLWWGIAAQTQAMNQSLNEVSELVDAGVIRTTFAESLGAIDAANLKKAHALIESG